MTTSESNKNFKFIEKNFESVSGKTNKEYLLKWYILLEKVLIYHKNILFLNDQILLVGA